MLAALLYLGAALLISVFRVFSRIARQQSPEAQIRRSDALTLGGVVGFGGVLGPVLVLFGLARISALTGSLLLNLEAVFTILLAVIDFHEHLSRSLAAASGLVVLGALLLSNQPGNLGGGILGMMAVLGACLSWAIDNNVSQRLSLREPTAVVQAKTAGAGLTSLVLALATGHTLPAAPAKAHYIIAERLRATPRPLSALERAIAFLRTELRGRERGAAKVVFDAARKVKISPATLTRARWKLGLRSVKKPHGWVWSARQS
jgi:drug/metabolite transporter (DMT)-like permease